MTTALDPHTHTKILWGIEDYEHEGLWTIVSRKIVKIWGPNRPARQEPQYHLLCRVFDVQLMLHPRRPSSDPGLAL